MRGQVGKGSTPWITRRRAAGLAVPAVLAAVGAAGLTGLLAQPAGAATTQSVLVSRTPHGGFPNQSTSQSSVSGDGRYVVYASAATDIVAGTQPTDNVYLFDTQTKVTTLVNRPVSGSPSADGSSSPRISANGRYVVYQSQAAHLVSSPAVPAHAVELYRYDVQTGRTVLVSQSGGVAAGATNSFDSSIGSDGRFIAYSTDAALVPSDTNEVGDVYLWDARTGRSRLVSHALGGSGAAGADSFAPSVTVNGRYVAFTSVAEDLVSQPVTAQVWNVYLADTTTGQIRLLSRPAAGGVANSNSGGPAISANGKVVVFGSQATNLMPGQPTTPQIFAVDLDTGRLTLVSGPLDSFPGGVVNSYPSVSATGRWVSYLVDPVAPASKQHFIYRTDLLHGDAVALSFNATMLYPSISGDGQHVSYGKLTAHLDSGPTFDPTYVTYLWNVP